MGSKGGRPPHKPTDASRKMVESMAGYGIPWADIAKVVGVHHETLKVHYMPQLEQGKIKACTKVAENLFRQATKDAPTAVTAAIWWTKTQMGWKETTVSEHVGKDGGPIQTEDVSAARESFERRIAGVASRLGTDGPPPKPH